MNKDRFSFEDLEVWQEAVDFADKCLDIIERVQTNRRHYRLVEQLESAATSPALNVAEAEGMVYELSAMSHELSAISQVKDKH